MGVQDALLRPGLIATNHTRGIYQVQRQKSQTDFFELGLRFSVAAELKKKFDFLLLQGGVLEPFFDGPVTQNWLGQVISRFHSTEILGWRTRISTQFSFLRPPFCEKMFKSVCKNNSKFGSHDLFFLQILKKRNGGVFGGCFDGI